MNLKDLVPEITESIHGIYLYFRARTVTLLADAESPEDLVQSIYNTCLQYAQKVEMELPGRKGRALTNKIIGNLNTYLEEKGYNLA